MWVNVLITTDAHAAERFSEALLAVGALSVEIEDADAGTLAEVPQFGEPAMPSPSALWARSRIKALFPADADANAPQNWLANAAAVCGLPAPADYQTESVDEMDWVRESQSQFAPIKINTQLTIVPSWHSVAAVPGVCQISLDPGLAFGTGSHPTTQLCLDWLCQEIKGSERVLDYGCGSGILAIAAAKLGAKQVTAVDIDAEALVAARQNANKNHVDINILGAEALPEAAHYERIVANILTNPLRLLAPLICARLAVGGKLALSGVLVEQIDEVSACYADQGVTLTLGETREGWVRLEGQCTAVTDVAANARRRRR